MTEEEMYENVHKLLDRWGDQIAALHALPVLLIAVGRDHHFGRFETCTLEGVLPTLDLVRILRQVIARLEKESQA